MWTKQEDADLLRYWPLMSASEVAERLGRTKNAVIGRFHRIDGTYKGRKYRYHRRRSEEAAQRCQYAQQIELKAIEKMRCDIRCGVARDAAIIEAVNAGAKQTTIAALFGLTRQAISLVVNKHI